MQKPRLSLGQIGNMSFGFLGIQFGWGLQLANMSAIYSYLGAKDSDIPLLWLAGPVTGLIVQPIIGAMSDRTWNWLGRRRPYFLVGAILSSIALFIMPDSTSVRMAAALLWVLDASINISMEPFRAFVADKLDPAQRNTGFVMQSFFIGIGASLANALPYVFRYAGVSGTTSSGIPLTVQYSFKIGAVVFLLAILWTVLTSKEYPPEDLAAFERKRAEPRGIVNLVGSLLAEIVSAIRDMPATMKQLAFVQLFTWLGLFCMWLFFGLATSYHVFGATSPQDPRFALGGEWGGHLFCRLFSCDFPGRLCPCETCQPNQPQDCPYDSVIVWQRWSAVRLFYSRQIRALTHNGWGWYCLGLNLVDALRDLVRGFARDPYRNLHGRL